MAPPPTTSAERAAYTEKMAYYLNKVNPVPTLPEYTGPYKVGTVDVEIPVADLKAPSKTPAQAGDIHTVLFRIYYPAQADSKGKRITWLPAPQRHHVSAYTKFLGFGSVTSEILSYVNTLPDRMCSRLILTSRSHPAFSRDMFITLQFPFTRTLPSSSPTTFPTVDGPP